MVPSKTPPQLCIIAGRWRRRRIRAVAGLAIRPTQGKVREAIFGRLQSRLGRARVIDLFAGSGALGLEALSRGAAQVLFVEQDPRALQVLRSNVAALAAGDSCRIVAGDVFSFLRGALGPPVAVDLLLADPPYGGLSRQVAEACREPQGLVWGPGALRVIECAKDDPDWETAPGWRRLPDRCYGKTRVVIEERKE